jgi:hypothetical protein
MKSPNRFQRLLKARLLSFCTALALHLGWALALAVLLIAVRRGLAKAGPGNLESTFALPLASFAAVCAAGSAVVWGGRQQVVRWLRNLDDEDISATLAAACTAGVSMSLIGLVAVGIPSLARQLSPVEMQGVMIGSLAVIGTLAVSLGWVLFEGLSGVAPSLPGKLEASLSRHRSTTSDA